MADGAGMMGAGFTLCAGALPAAPPFAVPTHVGAVVCFEGIVRDTNEGRAVVRLEYTAYEILAEREGSGIVRDAVARFAVADAACVHRIGVLEPGEPAVKVWAASAHRSAAFAACQFIIDQVKASVPIWKKESYRDGTQAWASCQHEHGAGEAIPPHGR